MSKNGDSPRQKGNPPRRRGRAAGALGISTTRRRFLVLGQAPSQNVSGSGLSGSGGRGRLSGEATASCRFVLVVPSRRHQGVAAQAAKGEDQERVAVELLAEQVVGRRDVLAGVRPVRTGALRFQVLASFAGNSDRPTVAKTGSMSCGISPARSFAAKNA